MFMWFLVCSPHPPPTPTHTNLGKFLFFRAEFQRFQFDCGHFTHNHMSQFSQVTHTHAASTCHCQESQRIIVLRNASLKTQIFYSQRPIFSELSEEELREEVHQPRTLNNCKQCMYPLSKKGFRDELTGGYLTLHSLGRIENARYLNQPGLGL